ncbi:TPA: hypothetical protein ACH3X2_005197 [Trebouxia sp. C0005]
MPDAASPSADKRRGPEVVSDVESLGAAEAPSFFFVFFLGYRGIVHPPPDDGGELSTLRQMMEVPNEPGLSPNNGLENALLSDQSMASNPRKGQAKRFGAKTTSHDGKAEQQGLVPDDEPLLTAVFPFPGGITSLPIVEGPTAALARLHPAPSSGELSTLRQMMEVPNEPGLSPNNGLENALLSDQSMASNPRKGQAKRFGAKTTSHDGKAGHVMTHVCHCVRQED